MDDVLWFDAMIAYSPSTNTFAAGLIGALYLETDTSFTTPMTVAPVGGEPTTTLISGALAAGAFIPKFSLTRSAQSPPLTGTQGPRLVWKSGAHQVTLTSLPFLISEVTTRLSAATLDAAYLNASSQQASDDLREHVFWDDGAWKVRVGGAWATPGSRPAWAVLGRHFEGDTPTGDEATLPTSLQADGDKLTLHPDSPLRDTI